MDVLQRIEDLRKRNGWSVYKLAMEAGLTISTVTNMFSRRTQPSIATLTAICEAFGITLAQFFTDGQAEAVLSGDEDELLQNYRKLSERNKLAVAELVKNLG